MSISEDPSDRTARSARNQTVYRGFNDRLNELEWPWGFVTPVRAWSCECANESCDERVDMAAGEYKEVRQREAHFFVVPSDDHFSHDVERLIDQHDRYWVVAAAGGNERRTEA